MPQRVIIAIVLILLGCKNQESKSDGFSPNWKVGDHRMFNEKGDYFVKVAGDTISYVTYDKTLKITISSEDADGYILLIESLPTKEFNFNTTIDSLKPIAVIMITQIKEIFKDFGKLKIPYRLRVNKGGEIIGIQDFDEYYLQFIEQVFQIKDTINITEEKRQTLKMLSQDGNSMGLKERLEKALVKEVTDYFIIYGIKNPKDGDIIEQGSEVDPTTGEPTYATMTYHNVTLNEGIQEIDLTVRYDDPLKEMIGSDSVTADTKRKVSFNDMNNLTKYRFNTQTGWLESLGSNVHYLNDSIQMRLSSDVRVYK